MSIERRLSRLEAAGRPAPEDAREREEERKRIREMAEHMNTCSGGAELFEITEGGIVLCAVDGKPITAYAQLCAEQDYWQEMEWMAFSLVSGHEPLFSLDEAGALRSPDGRFAVSRERADLLGLMGPRGEAAASSASPERWQRFLEDEEAAEILEELMDLAEAAIVPDSYREPAHRWHDLGEINDQLGDHDLGSIFADAEEREATRRLTWTLSYVPQARALLSELTGLRDGFVANEKGGSW